MLPAPTLVVLETAVLTPMEVAPAVLAELRVQVARAAPLGAWAVRREARAPAPSTPAGNTVPCR